MKTGLFLSMLMVTVLLAAPVGLYAQTPMGTAFSYQGRLTDGGSPANGQYDFKFSLYDALSVGNQVGTTLDIGGVNVANGLFTVPLDFGSGIFTGNARWLEIGVKPFGDDLYTKLSPRQELTPTPYALYADVAGSVLGGGTCLWQQNGSNIYYNSGYVGIGTASPVFPLAVEGQLSNNINPLAIFRTTGTDSAAAVRFANAGGNNFNLGITGNNNLALAYNIGISTSSDLLRMTPEGNVGIGTPDPYYKLEVGKTTESYNYLRLHAANYSGLLFYDGEGSYSGEIYYDHLGDYMQFRTRSASGAEERMRITSEGNVGIGTDSPAHRLHVMTDQAYGGYFDSAATTVYAQGVCGRADGPAGGADGTVHYGVTGFAANAHNNFGVFGEGSGGTNNYGGKFVCEDEAGAINYGVVALAANASLVNYGVAAFAHGGSYTYGIYAHAYDAEVNYAGYFEGDVEIIGTLSKSSGSFKIDHPLDPENKYLQHSFVESPDMMNVYNGNVVLDENGAAVITMPDWFEALNMDFRYQLTCIGGFAPVYIAEEVSDNRFKIAGGKAGLKVSWQVTGIRKDPYAKANRIQVEVDKRDEEKAKYLHPEAYGLARDKGISALMAPPEVPKP